MRNMIVWALILLALVGGFFAFYSKEEFLDLFEDKFELIEFKRTPLGKRVFLEFLFRKI